MKPAHSLLAALSLFAAAACTNPNDSCTEIGCSDGLVVFIQGSPVGPWRVDVSATGLESRSFTCPAGEQCTAARFPGFMPSTATVVVTINGATATSQVTLVEHLVRPNGPGCEPVCNQPQVTVSPPPQ